MATSDRPSGLTALAVINFIFSLVEFLGVITLIVTRLFFSTIEAQHGMNEKERRIFEAMSDFGWLNVIVVAALGALAGLLLLLSGIGYLRRRRFLGRWTGNAYALVAFAYIGASLLIVPAELTGGLTLGVIRSLFYPLLTLLLLNFVFRRDLVR